MNAKFENDFQKKIMFVSFDPGFLISNKKDVLSLRQAWTQELKSWHSPYKALVDGTNFNFDISQKDLLGAEFNLMFKFLEGFFLRKTVGFNFKPELTPSLPFTIFDTYEDAADAVGAERVRKAPNSEDFRASIVMENHFPQHTIEISFAHTFSLDNDKVKVLKSKLLNNLMQWHSKWNLLLDFKNITVEESQREAVSQELQTVLKFFSSLFMKKVVGYGAKIDYLPFSVFRSRHKAVAELEAEGYFSGDKATCRSDRSEKKLER